MHVETITDTLHLAGETGSLPWSRDRVPLLLLPGWFGVLVLACFHPPSACLLAADGAAKGPITATLSIVAADPATGQCGAAVASKYPSVGKVVPYVRGGVGAYCTQHWHHPPWGETALDLLQRGTAPADVLGTLPRNDADRDQRQLAIVHSHGRTASVNPTAANQASRSWGAMAGCYYACQSNNRWRRPTGGPVLPAGPARHKERPGRAHHPPRAWASGSV
jgi:hypothetical protein